VRQNRQRIGEGVRSSRPSLGATHQIGKRNRRHSQRLCGKVGGVRKRPPAEGGGRCCPGLHNPRPTHRPGRSHRRKMPQGVNTGRNRAILLVLLSGVAPADGFLPVLGRCAVGCCAVTASKVLDDQGERFSLLGRGRKGGHAPRGDGRGHILGFCKLKIPIILLNIK
jgi:hypothetical protein